MQKLLTIPAAILLTGCAALTSTKEDQMNSSGPVGANHPCTFGGVDAEADRYCARLAFGIEGELQMLAVTVAYPGMNCEEFVRQMQKAIGGAYESRMVVVTSLPESHAALRVETPEGVYYVDNGAMNGGYHVMTEAEFTAMRGY